MTCVKLNQGVEKLKQKLTEKQNSLFSKNSRYLREAYRLKQSELAEALGNNIPQGYISVFESGKKAPPADVVLKYLELFNLSEKELLETDLSTIELH